MRAADGYVLPFINSGSLGGESVVVGEDGKEKGALLMV